MKVDDVDPRDTRWELDEPAYRVYFWHQPAARVDVRRDDVMWHCDEHRLTGALDVSEVLNWARSTARTDQTFTVYVEHHDGERPGLIRLMGVDPTSGRHGTPRSS